MADKTKKKSNNIIKAPCGTKHKRQTVTIYSKHILRKLLK